MPKLASSIIVPQKRESDKSRQETEAHLLRSPSISFTIPITPFDYLFEFTLSIPFFQNLNFEQPDLWSSILDGVDDILGEVTNGSRFILFGSKVMMATVLILSIELLPAFLHSTTPSPPLLGITDMKNVVETETKMKSVEKEFQMVHEEELAIALALEDQRGAKDDQIEKDPLAIGEDDFELEYETVDSNLPAQSLSEKVDRDYFNTEDEVCKSEGEDMAMDCANDSITTSTQSLTSIASSRHNTIDTDDIDSFFLQQVNELTKIVRATFENLGIDRVGLLSLHHQQGIRLI